VGNICGPHPRPNRGRPANDVVVHDVEAQRMTAIKVAQGGAGRDLQVAAWPKRKRLCRCTPPKSSWRRRKQSGPGCRVTGTQSLVEPSPKKARQLCPRELGSARRIGQTHMLEAQLQEGHIGAEKGMLLLHGRGDDEPVARVLQCSKKRLGPGDVPLRRAWLGNTMRRF